LHPRRIWVVDDTAARDAWEKDLLTSAAPGVDVRVVTVAEAVVAHAGETSAEGGAFLLVRDLAAALRLVEAGAVVRTLNLGGLHYAPGRTKVNEYIYLDNADRSTARALLAYGVTLEVQDVPASKPVSLRSLDATLDDAGPGATPA
jgi:mannose/fructose/N-acetylgalactosamine-specific phosphotransferase system component IIB